MPAMMVDKARFDDLERKEQQGMQTAMELAQVAIFTSRQ
jgi:hypothetical protein